MSQDTTPQTVTAVIEDEDCTDDSTPSWHLFGTECPKEEIVFLCQVVILYTVIVISIYNLTAILICGRLC